MGWQWEFFLLKLKATVACSAHSNVLTMIVVLADSSPSLRPACSQAKPTTAHPALRSVHRTDRFFAPLQTFSNRCVGH
eukprot:525212-Hanusia_phi.AAC.5